MSVAWTTIAIIALLFPGVFFFIGLTAGERFSKEIVRSNAIGEVGLAILVSLILHLIAYAIVSPAGFDLARFLQPVIDFDSKRGLPASITVSVWSAGYTVLMAAVGWILGWITARLQLFTRHKWITTVDRSMREGVVTAYVMTTALQNGRALMYKGVLAEFYLTVDGSLTYIVLKNCSRYLMKMDGDEMTTTEQLKLFGSDRAHRTKQFWDYLFIDAKNIANVLFDPSPEIKMSGAGNAALERALAGLPTAIQKKTLAPANRPLS